jgi:probable addiction module antidote protein
MAKATSKDHTSHSAPLDDPATAAAYVNAALEEEVEDEEELFLLALRTIAQAHGMSNLAAETALKRENLYRMLSAAGNPRLSSLCTLLRALGLRLAVDIRGSQRSARTREQRALSGRRARRLASTPVA